MQISLVLPDRMEQHSNIGFVTRWSIQTTLLLDLIIR